MRIYVGGHVFSGTPIQILTGMKCIAHDVNELDLSSYIEWIIQRAAWIDGILLAVEEGSLHDRAKALLEAMMEAGLALDDEIEGVESERTTDIWSVAVSVTAA